MEQPQNPLMQDPMSGGMPMSGILGDATAQFNPQQAYQEASATAPDIYKTPMMTQIMQLAGDALGAVAGVKLLTSSGQVPLREKGRQQAAGIAQLGNSIGQFGAGRAQNAAVEQSSKQVHDKYISQYMLDAKQDVETRRNSALQRLVSIYQTDPNNPFVRRLINTAMQDQVVGDISPDMANARETLKLLTTEQQNDMDRGKLETLYNRAGYDVSLPMNRKNLEVVMKLVTGMENNPKAMSAAKAIFDQYLPEFSEETRQEFATRATAFTPDFEMRKEQLGINRMNAQQNEKTISINQQYYDMVRDQGAFWVATENELGQKLSLEAMLEKWMTEDKARAHVWQKMDKERQKADLPSSLGIEGFLLNMWRDWYKDDQDAAMYPQGSPMRPGPPDLESAAQMWADIANIAKRELEKMNKERNNAARATRSDSLRSLSAPAK